MQAQYFGGSSSLPAGANAETGITFNRVDTQSGSTPVPIPVSAGVNFAYLKALALAVTATSTTTISNRTVRLSAGLASGLGMHWKPVAQGNWGASLDQSTATKAPADTTGTNNASTAPGGYSVTTTSPVQFDNTAQSTSATGIGTVQLLAMLLAVDATYAGGPGSASLGNIILGYDEA